MYRQIAGTAVVFSLVFLATLGVEGYVRTATSPMPFDSETWIRGDRDTRARMVGSLLDFPLAEQTGACFRERPPKGSVLYEAAYEDVIRILGKPDFEESREYGDSTEIVKYYLGNRGNRIGGQYVLHLDFDENERVESFFVGR